MPLEKPHVQFSELSGWAEDRFKGPLIKTPERVNHP